MDFFVPLLSAASLHFVLQRAERGYESFTPGPEITGEARRADRAKPKPFQISVQAAWSLKVVQVVKSGGSGESEGSTTEKVTQRV